mmetsp:Transcript_16365/g.40240  ORF Transcript_16365/g.40240 Transcript_16365/m.40240 type:complete len:482 (-) Transcript_16365:210-1655(-)
MLAGGNVAVVVGFVTPGIMLIFLGNVCHDNTTDGSLKRRWIDRPPPPLPPPPPPPLQPPPPPRPPPPYPASDLTAASIVFTTLKLGGIDIIDFDDDVQTDFKTSVSIFAGVDSEGVKIHRITQGSVILGFSVAFPDVIFDASSNIRFQRYKEIMRTSPAVVLRNASTPELRKVVNVTKLDERFEDQQVNSTRDYGAGNYWLYVYAFAFAALCTVSLYVMPRFGADLPFVETVLNKLGLGDYVSIFKEQTYFRPLLSLWDVSSMALSIFDFVSDLQFAYVSSQCSSTYQTVAFIVIGTSMFINLLVIVCTIGFLRGKLIDSNVLARLPLVYWPVIILSLTSTNHLKALPWIHRNDEWEIKGSLRESFPVKSFPEDHSMTTLTYWSARLFGLRSSIIWATVIFEDIPQIILVIFWSAHGSKHKCVGANDWASVESLFLSAVNIAVAVVANVGNTCGSENNDEAERAQKDSHQRRQAQVETSKI